MNLKIEEIRVRKFAMITLNSGVIFRVWDNTCIDVWSNELLDFTFFDEDVYSVEVRKFLISQMRQALGISE